MSDANDNNDLHLRIAALPRQCISCDACDAPAPSLPCERCQFVFYCNDKCLERHAAEHRPDCHDMKAFAEQREARLPSKEELLSAASEDAINSDCGICLEEQMEQPVTLDCKHAFCSTCLVAWQRQQRDPTNEYRSEEHVCPICRAETEGTVEADLMLRARSLATRAALLRNDPDVKRILLVKALDVLNKLLEVELPHLQAYITKVEVLRELGEYKQEIDAIEELMAINDERVEKYRILAGIESQVDDAMARSSIDEVERLQEEYVNYAEKNNCMSTRISQDDVVDLWISKAEAYMELKEWENAKEVILKNTPLMTMTSNDGMSPPRTRRCIMGLARCAYEMNRYEKAIDASNWAIEMNRGFPGVYKYKALAQKSLGDLDAAIATMNRAVLYETPWDDDNRRIALAMYDELLAEKNQKKEDL